MIAVATEYESFLDTKRLIAASVGFDVAPDAINPKLFEFQRDIVRWCARKGRSAVFAGTGLGKTAMFLEWARLVCEHTGGDVLILAPLAVAPQIVREGEKFGIPVTHARDGADVRPGVTVANYERLHRFDPSHFVGVVLDESSRLKDETSATRNAVIEAFARTPYRLCATATPAPNDHVELGNHAEFLGVMSRVEMLSMFFVHDGGATQNWRLKGHAETEFWRWVCSWAVMLRTPSDLGYEDGDFLLPPLQMHHHETEHAVIPEGRLFAMPARTMSERRQARRASLSERVQAAVDLINASDEPWVVWCNLNAEGDALTKAINGAVQVAGADSTETKEQRLIDFTEGRFRVMVSKPKIAGHGLNWQHCPNVAFVGLSDSWEEYHQAIRRCWRYGQTRPVQCHVITSEAERVVVANIERKEQDAARMADAMVAQMADLNRADLQATARETDAYEMQEAQGDGWRAVLGDCVPVLREMAEGSIDYSIFSPPFASLYTYSNSARDMGNCRTHTEFYEHFQYAVAELYRVLKPGRLLSFHCMNLPTSKVRDGVIGISDFRGDLIRMFQDAGFIYHSEVVIWKDPVTAMQRTKALGLLHKQLIKDSCMSRQGIPDYLVTMRKPGVNPSRVAGYLEEFVGEESNEAFEAWCREEWQRDERGMTYEEFRSIAIWQRYASPVWMDINPSDTLQRESAREQEDEKHIAPLQLEVIRRALQLWTNPGDLVLSPFAGIGSEGFGSLKEGRRFVGVELKASYFRQSVANLHRAEHEVRQVDLFTYMTPSPAPVAAGEGKEMGS